jgi:HPt (histidine-containing phosphotransfer) domain-containing protein
VALLEQLSGDVEFARNVARTFLADLPKRIEAIQGHLSARDAKSVVHQAHTIKGAANAVSAASLAKSALALELAGKADDLADATRIFATLQEDFRRLESAMQGSRLLTRAVSHGK